MFNESNVLILLYIVYMYMSLQSLLNKLVWMYEYSKWKTLEMICGCSLDIQFFLFSPTVRLSNSSTTSVTKSKARPISATTPQDAPQNVYSTQRPPSASQRKTPPSRSGAVNNSMKVKRGTTKKDSTDESSSDDSDDSTDTN